MSKPLKFVSSKMQDQNLRTLAKLSKENPKEFRILARQEFKLVNQQIDRLNKNGAKIGQDHFVLRGKSNNEILSMLKDSRKFANSSKYFKTAKSKSRTQKRRVKSQSITAPTYSNYGGNITDYETPDFNTDEPNDFNIDEPTDFDTDDADDFETVYNDDTYYYKSYKITTGDVLNELKNKYPQFYEDLLKAVEKYREFDDEIMEEIQIAIGNGDTLEEIAQDIHNRYASRVGQILQKTDGARTNYWSSFRE
jgi:hypothetical protein